MPTNTLNDRTFEVDAEGFLTIKDRSKDMIISGGENIYPAEIENVILSRCSMCHAAEPLWAGIAAPPKGVRLDTPEMIRKHADQIRLQARLRGHTLVGEQRYVYGPDALRSVEFPRQALHAHRLSFQHPVDGRPLTFEAPLPADLTALVRRLRTPATPATRWRASACSTRAARRRQ